MQLAGPQFEFSGQSGTERNGTPSIGVSAFASDSDQYRHRPRSYSARGRFCRRILAWRHYVCGSRERGDIFGQYGSLSGDAAHGRFGQQAEVGAIIEHVLADRLGDWRVWIVRSQANDRWEMKIASPNAFERSYTWRVLPASIDRK
jgi:hypothetical protein